MTTPTPPAQDGEREKFSPWQSFDDLWAFGSDEDHALAITAPALSAELSALRAQVAERDAAWWCWLNQRGLIRGADSVLQYMAVVHQVEAALAPPQPVAKER